MANIIKAIINQAMEIFGVHKGARTKLINTPFVYRARKSNIDYIQMENGRPTANAIPDKLFINRGIYSFAGGFYSLADAGLYRFVYPEIENHQRIIHDDIITTMSSICWLMTHSEQDDHLEFDQLIEKAKQDKIYITCEKAVRFANQLLKQIDIKSRVIGARTLESWNTYDDGHYLIEVFDEIQNRWLLFDIDNDCCFVKNEKILSLREFEECSDCDYQILMLASDIHIRTDMGSYSYAFINEARQVKLKEWYSRIMQFCFIEDKDTNYANINNKIDFRCYPKGAFPEISYLTDDMFVKKFYQ